MVRATWMADRQSPGLLGCVGGSEWHRHDGQIMGCLASEGKVSRPEERRWKGSDGRVSAVRAGVREPVAEVW